MTDGTLRHWFAPPKRKRDEEPPACTWDPAPTEDGTATATAEAPSKRRASSTRSSSASTTAAATTTTTINNNNNTINNNNNNSPAVSSFFAPKSRASDGGLQPGSADDPGKIMCWNVNGLHSTLKFNGARIKSFMERESPDVLFLSEVKFKAPSKARQFELANADAKCGEEAKVLREALQPQGCLGAFAFKRLSLATKRYAGTAMLVRRGASRPSRVWFDLPDPADLGDPSSTPDRAKHDESGRIILAEWRTLFVLHTYSPNNGSSETSFQRRREWDARLTAWIEATRRVDPPLKPLIYCGDLNVAPSDLDLSHPSWFRRQFTPAPNGIEGDAGQPGCTPNEQARFREMLDRGGLVDALRAAEPRLGGQHDDPDGPYFTWRGHPGRASKEQGKYWGRGMRIDHVLVSHELLVRVDRVTIHGRGRGSEDPTFLGSDHCPISVSLRGNQSPEGQAARSIANPKRKREAVTR